MATQDNERKALSRWNQFFGAVLGGVGYPLSFFLGTLIGLLPTKSLSLVAKNYQAAKTPLARLKFASLLLSAPLLLTGELAIRAIERSVLLLGLANLPYIMYCGIYFGAQAGATGFLNQFKEDTKGFSEASFIFGKWKWWNDDAQQPEPVSSKHPIKLPAVFEETPEAEEKYQSQYAKLETAFPEKLASDEVKTLNEEYEDLKCPYTQMLPKEPVQLKCMTADGKKRYLHPQPFEREAVLFHFKQACNSKQVYKHPITRDQVVEIVLAPNITKRIDKLCAKITAFVQSLFQSTASQESQKIKSAPKAETSSLSKNPYGIFHPKTSDNHATLSPVSSISTKTSINSCKYR
jgi:hypothetical protein